MSVSIQTSHFANRWLVISLLIFAAILFFERLHTYSEILDRDICGYAVISHEMLQGRNLYSDLWERKPPLLFATFAAAELICGYGQNEIFFLNVAAAIATMLAVYFAGNGISESKRGGLFAAAFWVIICNDLNCQANQPNAEAFANFFIAAAFAVLVRWHTIGKLRPAVVLGVLFACASLYKQHVLIIFGTLACAHVFIAYRFYFDSKDKNVSSSMLCMVVAAGCILTCWGGVALYFALCGRFAFLFDALVRQNVSYAGSIYQNLYQAFLPQNVIPYFARWVWLFVALITACIFYCSRVHRWELVFQPAVVLWSSWAVGTAITFALPGKGYHHYFQLWMPVWAVAGGWAAEILLRENRLAIRFVNRIVLVAVVSVMLIVQLNQFVLSPEEWAARKSLPGEDLPDQYRMALWLAHSLAPTDSFYNIGEDNTLYFYSKKSPASGLLYLDPFDTGEEQSQYDQRLINDLKRSQPAMLVISQMWRITSLERPALPEWIRQNYTEISQENPDPRYRLFAKTGSVYQRRFPFHGVLPQR